jgi:hypothetical protein
MSFNTKTTAWIEPVRWILGADIDNTYQAMENADGDTCTLNPSRVWLLQNGTDGDIMVSIDKINMHIPVFKGSATVIDLMANHPEPGGANALPQNIAVWVTALSTAGGGGAPFAGAGYTDPTTGAVFLTAFYGR